VEAEERVEVGAPLLGDHLAVPLGVQAVDHHPVEPGERPDPAGGVGRHLDDRRRALQGHRLTDDRGRVRVGAVGRLDLDDEERLGTMERRGELVTVAGQRDVVATLHPTSSPRRRRRG
jgi:hypothetical protein